jgi:hypothetical protein
MPWISSMHLSYLNQACAACHSFTLSLLAREILALLKIPRPADSQQLEDPKQLEDLSSDEEGTIRHNFDRIRHANPLTSNQGSPLLRDSVVASSVKRLRQLSPCHLAAVLAGGGAAATLLALGCYAINRASGTNSWTVGVFVVLIVILVMVMPFIFKPVDAAKEAALKPDEVRRPEPLTETDSNAQMVLFVATKRTSAPQFRRGSIDALPLPAPEPEGVCLLVALSCAPEGDERPPCARLKTILN